MKPWVQYLGAFAVFVHAYIYTRVGLALPHGIPEWTQTSWLLRGVNSRRLIPLVIALHVIAGAVLIACSVAIAFSTTFPGMWRPLAITGATTGIVAFAAFWDGQTETMTNEGLIGAVGNVFLLVAAIALPAYR
jgi:hypothetical protein